MLTTIFIFFSQMLGQLINSTFHLVLQKLIANFMNYELNWSLINLKVFLEIKFKLPFYQKSVGFKILYNPLSSNKKFKSNLTFKQKKKKGLFKVE